MLSGLLLRPNITGERVVYQFKTQLIDALIESCGVSRSGIAILTIFN